MRVEVSESTMEAMEQEFRTLQLPTSVESLATTWIQSDLIMMCHEDEAMTMKKAYGELLGRSSSISTTTAAHRSRELKDALKDLMTSVGSLTERVTSWEEAQTILSRVVVTVRKEAPPKKVESVFQKQIGMTASLAKYMKHVTVAVRGRGYMKEIENWGRVEYMLSESTKLKTEEDSAVVKIESLLEHRISETERKLKTLKIQAAKKQPKFALPQISSQDETTIQSAMKGSPNEVVATDPKGGGDEVLRHSLQTLQPKTWLNDEVIHYFCQLLSYRDELLCSQRNNSKRSHFFKSFFMTKLLDDTGTYQYNNVKRWSKRVPGKDIFGLNKIFFPVNVGAVHWTLAVIDMPQKKIVFYDSMSGSYGKVICQALFRYLQDEWKNKKSPDPFPDKDDWILEPFPPDIPQQQNGYDCGVFTCMYADLISRNIPLNFTQQQITECRRHIALSILQGKVKC